MAFSADTMAVTLALAKKYTNTSITNSLTGVKSIEPDSTKTKLIVTTMDDQVFEIDIQQTFTAEQVELINRMSTINDELAFDGVVIEGLTPEQSALLVSFNDHIQNFSNPHKTRISNLTDVEIDTPIDGQVIMLEGGKYKNKTLNIPTDGKVKMEDGSPSKFLSEQIDGTTISKNETNTLSAVGLKGMDTSIPELNYISGLDEPIMTKFAKFGNGNIEVYKTVFPTYASLIQFDFTTLTQGTTFLMYVSDDETHQNLGTIYLCDKDTNDTDNLPSYAGLSSAPQRDFTVDKINLETEVKGVLPKANMDLSGLATSDELIGYMPKSVYDPNNDGIVNSAETLKGLTKTPQELNKDINVDSIIAGRNITVEKDEINNTVTINSTGGGGGGSSVAPSEINGNIINNGEQMVVYDDSQVQSDIDNLNNRSVIGSENVYFGAKLSAPQTTTTIGENIKFDTIVKNSSNSEITLNNGVFKLKGGVKWNVRCGVRILGTGFLSYQIYNLTEQSFESTSSQVISVTNTTNANQSAIIDEILEPNIDCLYEIRIVYSTNVTSIDSNMTNLRIFEIGRTAILDPIEYAQDHDIKYGEFSTSVNTATANVPLVLDTTISGTMTLDTARNGIRVTGGKTYKIQIYGTPIISSMASLKCYIYDCTNNVNTNKLVGQSVSVTSTDNWTNLGSGLYFKPESSMTISVLFDRNITNLNGGGAFKILIEEVKNPVLINSEKVIEISNPLMSSKISQEAPIGTIIRYDGNNVPNYYLPCDGAIYNISDYLALFNEIGNKYGGDGITTFAVPNYGSSDINITPTMTSNTTPSPYVVTSSGIYGAQYDSFKAFDGSNATLWETPNNTVTGWIQLDFGTKVVSNKISIFGSNSSNNVIYCLKSFDLYGSNDGLEYDKLLEVRNEMTWTENETRNYSFKNSNSYRYYKLDILENQGGTVGTILTELKFLEQRWTSFIKSEATHYAINQYGGFQMDTLWEGSVSTNNSTINLVYSYMDYDYLYLSVEYDGVYTNIPIHVKQIVDNITYFGAQVFSIGSVDTTCRFLFTSNTALRLTNSVGNISINKVIGVRGSVPTVIEGGAL